MPAGPFRGERWGALSLKEWLAVLFEIQPLCLIAFLVLTSALPIIVCPLGSYLNQLETSPGKLRIAFTDTALFGNETHQDNRAALQHTVKLLEELGMRWFVSAQSLMKALVTIMLWLVGVALGVR